MNAVTNYDLTIPERKDLTLAMIVDDLKQWAKEWAFQREVSEETKYEHWQVRMRLIKKKRLPELVKALSTTSLKGHLSISSTNSGKTFNYVMKADTRVQGPWTSKDGEIIEMPEDLKLYITPRPWQKSIEEECISPGVCTRFINLVYDPNGNIGKSMFVKWMDWHKKAGYVPPFKDLEKFMGFVASMQAYKAYMIDMPRAMDKTRMSGFWSAIEQLKNGFVFDWRHKGLKKHMTQPRIWVFTNKLPNPAELSADRWKYWMISSTMTLCKYTPERMAIATLKRKDIDEQKAASSDDESPDDVPYVRVVKQKI